MLPLSEHSKHSQLVAGLIQLTDQSSICSVECAQILDKMQDTLHAWTEQQLKIQD